MPLTKYISISFPFALTPPYFKPLSPFSWAIAILSHFPHIHFFPAHLNFSHLTVKINVQIVNYITSLLLHTILWFPISIGIKFKLLTKNKQFVMLSFLNISQTSLFIPFFLLIILQTHWLFFSLLKTCQVLPYSKKFSLTFLEYCLYGCFSSLGYHGSFPNKPSKQHSHYWI